MYRSLIETDAPLALTLGFAAVVFVAGAIARALRWLITAEKNHKLTSRRPYAETTKP
jgi:hypothetical protein